MAIIIQDQVLRQIKVLYKSAYSLKSYFEDESDVSVLLGHFDVLEKEYRKLCNFLPEDFQPQSQLARHIGWMNRYLREGKPHNCIADIMQICDCDIDDFELSYIEYFNNKHLNSEIAAKVVKLLVENNPDSAIRKALLILTESLRIKFSMPKDIDGEDLVNKIFGGKGILNGIMPDGEREKYRNFLSGFYGLVRNDFMHNDKNSDLFEAESIVSFINLILDRIQKIEV